MMINPRREIGMQRKRRGESPHASSGVNRGYRMRGADVMLGRGADLKIEDCLPVA